MNYPRLRIQRAPTSMETTPIKIDGRISRRRHGGSAEETTIEHARAYNSATHLNQRDQQNTTGGTSGRTPQRAKAPRRTHQANPRGEQPVPAGHTAQHHSERKGGNTTAGARPRTYAPRRNTVRRTPRRKSEGQEGGGQEGSRTITRRG